MSLIEFKEKSPSIPSALVIAEDGTFTTRELGENDVILLVTEVIFAIAYDKLISLLFKTLKYSRMFAYKTNSADYLDYIASVKSRAEIQADPDLCLLLNNPYIKDNMQVAIRWNAAKTGDYQDKYDFLQYFFCNGPQLDADTIMHYRAKAFDDPICMEIAYSYLSDTNHLAQIRQEKYNKPRNNDWSDCFTNPCFYLGKFSAMMGNCGDSENTRTPWNCVAKWVSSVLTPDKKRQIRQNAQTRRGQRDETSQKPKTNSEPKKDNPQQGEKPRGANTKVEPGGAAPDGKNETPPDSPPAGGGRNAFKGVIIPAVQRGWNEMWAQILLNKEGFVNQLCNCQRTALNAQKIGDALCQPISEMLDIVTKANVKRQMGDCARLWSHVRRLRLFGSQNAYGPIKASQLVGKTNTDGTPQQPIANTNPSSSDSSVVLNDIDNRNKKNAKKNGEGTNTAGKTTKTLNAEHDTQYVGTIDEQASAAMQSGGDVITTPSGETFYIGGNGAGTPITDTTSYTRTLSDGRVARYEGSALKEIYDVDSDGHYTFSKDQTLPQN